jgi:DNA-binding beta-propeller fold protein YncE
VRRTAVVSLDGSKLYLSGYHTEVVEGNGQVGEKTVPLGLQVVNTQTWQVDETLDLPVGAVHLSPDDSMLLAAGYTESAVFAISTDSYQVTHFETAGNEWTTTIEFSADAPYAYLNDRHQIQVIDLQRLEIVSEFGSSAPLRVWGPAGVISESLGD